MKAWIRQINFASIHQWVDRVYLQRLETAYRSAVTIEEIENKYFDGGSISFSPDRGKITSDYFRTQRDRELVKIRFNLIQFRLGSLFVKDKINNSNSHPDQLAGSNLSASEATAASILEKLAFIESVISKYRHDLDTDLSLLGLSSENASDSLNKSIQGNSNDRQTTSNVVPGASNWFDQRNYNSLFKQFKQVGREIDPEYEQQIIRELRSQQKQKKTALRWLLVLLIVPIAIQILTKNLIFEPFLSGLSDRDPAKVELTQEVREEFLTEFSYLKENLEINQLLGLSPHLTEAEKTEHLKEAAVELWQETRDRAQSGLTNILADGVALVVFTGIVYFGRKQLAILRSFSNQTFLNLSDPAKVFLFILITDLFVGFHSAEGWDTILSGVSHHFGLPENKAAINIFIATVPVMIDSFVKFWIFTYLTRYSPSSSAIYERMNT